MLRSSRLRFDRFWLLLLILPPLLIFPNLGNTFLWQDEAETALLGRSVVRHGLPVAHDGRRTISDQPGAPDVSEGGLWIWTPWLQHYAVAGSFALFGESNTTARLPFALAGWGTILVSYGFFRAIAQRLLTARLAVLLLTTSVPFLLQVRQCRYYAWVPLFVVLHLWGYLRLARSQKGGASLLTVSGLGLFFTLLPQLVVSTLAVLADALSRRNRRLLAPVLACSALVAVLSLPYFFYTEGWSRDYLGLGHGYDSPARYVATLRAYLVAVQIYAWPFLWAGVALLASSRDLRPDLGRAAGALAVIAPIVFAIAATAPPGPASFAVLSGTSILAFGAGLVWILRRESRSAEGPFLRWGSGVIAVLLFLGVALDAALAPNAYFRYLVGLLPLFALATAMMLEMVARQHRVLLAAGVLCLLLFDGVQRLPLYLGNSFHRALGTVDPTRFHSAMPLDWSYGDRAVNRVSFAMLSQLRNRYPSSYWLRDYLDELFLDYDGPVEAVVRHLWADAQPEDVFLVRYGHFPFMYYTDLQIRRWDEAASLEHLPEWMFFHGFKRYRLPDGILGALDRYERVPLEAREFYWENVPEPHYHWFRTRRNGDPVKLFRLREGASRELAAPPMSPAPEVRP